MTCTMGHTLGKRFFTWWSIMVFLSSCRAACQAYRPALRGRAWVEASVADGRRLSHVEATELLVVEEFCDGRMRAAEWAVGIAPDADLAEPHSQCIIHHQASYQRLPLADNELDGFRRLDNSNHSRQHAQDPDLTARRHHARRGRSGEETAVARPCVRLEDAYLALKLENAAVHDRLPDQHRGIVHQVACGEIVGAIDDDVIVPKDVHDVVHGQALIVDAHLDIGIEAIDRLLGRLSLGHTNAVGAMQYLAFEVRAYPHVRIPDAQRADPRRGQVQCHRGPESPGPDQ